jgi:hypothetical protein
MWKRLKLFLFVLVVVVVVVVVVNSICLLLLREISALVFNSAALKSHDQRKEIFIGNSWSVLLTGLMFLILE